MTDPKIVLHVGCGPLTQEHIHSIFRQEGWKEVRVDADSSVGPDIVSDMTTLAQVPSEYADGIYTAHALEHLHPDNAFSALVNFKRVLKPGGRLIIRVPDIKHACKAIAKGRINAKLYDSPCGPIGPLDVLYSYREFTRGNSLMWHRWGYTKENLELALLSADFSSVNVFEDVPIFELLAFARK